MSNQPARRTSTALVLFGAMLGAALGMALWYGVLSPNRGLKNNPDPAAQSMAKLFAPIDACLAVTCLIIGAGLGAFLGRVFPVKVPPSPDQAAGSPPASSLPASASHQEEVDRLREQVARLEEKIDELQQEDTP